ncbi:MAG: NHL repeat-containing protein [Planctomycetota bacterium]|jgi:hypothetical protein
MTHHSADTSWDTSDMKAQRGLTALNLLIGLAILAAIIVAVVAITKMDPRGTRTTRTGHRYVKGARAAAAVDQALIGWQESATAMTVDMASPRGIAVDKADRIYVIGDRLVVLTASGKVALRSDTFAGDYQAVAIGPNGRAFAVTKTRVDVLDIDLRIDGATAQVKSSRDLEAEKVGLASITVTTDGIFVADSYGCRVLRLPHATAQGKPEVFAKGFNVPSVFDLTRSPDGDVVTVDPGRHRVQVRDGYGDVVRSFGQTGNDIADFHGCCTVARCRPRKGSLPRASRSTTKTASSRVSSRASMRSMTDPTAHRSSSTSPSTRRAASWCSTRAASRCACSPRKTRRRSGRTTSER